jgi:DNA-binding MarR family transcriptional regulator
MNKEKLVENIMTSGFQMYKRLSNGINAPGIPRGQFELLYSISFENGKPMKYYGEKLMISKPNLSVMADRLIEQGYAERIFDPNDRRIIILNVTMMGQEFLDTQVKRIKEEMLRGFDSLTNEDAQRLNEIIDEMKYIFNKLERGEEL